GISQTSVAMTATGHSRHSRHPGVSGSPLVEKHSFPVAALERLMKGNDRYVFATDEIVASLAATDEWNRTRDNGVKRLGSRSQNVRLFFSLGVWSTFRPGSTDRFRSASTFATSG